MSTPMKPPGIQAGSRWKATTARTARQRSPSMSARYLLAASFLPSPSARFGRDVVVPPSLSRSSSDVLGVRLYPDGLVGEVRACRMRPGVPKLVSLATGATSSTATLRAEGDASRAPSPSSSADSKPSWTAVDPDAPHGATIAPPSELMPGVVTSLVGVVTAEDGSRGEPWPMQMPSRAVGGVNVVDTPSCVKMLALAKFSKLKGRESVGLNSLLGEGRPLA